MEKDIVLGPEAKAVMKVEGGKVILGVQYDGKQASAIAQVSLSLDQYGVLLKNAIPGGIDDVVIDALLAVLKAAA